MGFENTRNSNFHSKKLGVCKPSILRKSDAGTSLPFYGVMMHVSLRHNWPSVTEWCLRLSRTTLITARLGHDRHKNNAISYL